ATAGRTTRWCAAHTTSTAPAGAAGGATSKAASSPGRSSSPTARARAPARPTTSRADGSAAPRTRGTCTAATARRLPLLGGRLLERWRAAMKTAKSPVAAWASIVENPEARRDYQRVRGMGGFVRSHWDEVNQLIAAANVYTIKTHGPDRVVGFSPIPAMSM